jgi:rod shape-determining protein MreC
MSRPGPHWPRFAARLRSMLGRSAAGLLLGLSVVLLLAGKADLRLASAVGAGVDDAVVRVLDVLNRPAVALRAALDRTGSYLAVREENARLREENRRLLAWQAEAAHLAVQNRALRRMLAAPADDRPARRLTAQVVGDSGGVFVRALLLDAGAEHGVEVGMPAMVPEGLAGRVIAVGGRSARVLLLTDFNSRIPVVIESSGDHAILEGDNSPLPLLRFLPLDPGFAVGDRVLTSGRGGVLPPGLLVGRIDGAAAGQVRVRPAVDGTRLDHLALLEVVSTPVPEAAAVAPAAAPGS